MANLRMHEESQCSFRPLDLGDAVRDEAAGQAHCPFVVVGGGYAGAETAATVQALTRNALRRFVHLRPEHRRWVRMSWDRF